MTATEVMVRLRRPPQKIFRERDVANANYLRFRLGPDEVSIAIGARTKKPGEKMAGENVELYVCNEQGGTVQPYERLIGDAIKGDASLFARQDSVEAAWRVVAPALKEDAAVVEYQPGTWGPPAAQALMKKLGGWRNPITKL